MTFADDHITSSITNNSLCNASPVWIQASLPIREGGLGIRSAVQLILSAFLASAAGCSSQVSQILQSQLQEVSLVARDEAFQYWSRGHVSPPPPECLTHRQREWDSLRVKAVAQAQIMDAPDARSRAPLLASRRKESGTWLNALPVTSLGLRIDDETTHVAVGPRLGTPICRPHECSHCGSKVDNLATYGLSCRWR